MYAGDKRRIDPSEIDGRIEKKDEPIKVYKVFFWSNEEASGVDDLIAIAEDVEQARDLIVKQQSADDPDPFYDKEDPRKEINVIKRIIADEPTIYEIPWSIRIRE